MEPQWLKLCALVWGCRWLPVISAHVCWQNNLYLFGEPFPLCSGWRLVWVLIWLVGSNFSWELIKIIRKRSSKAWPSVAHMNKYVTKIIEKSPSMCVVSVTWGRISFFFCCKSGVKHFFCLTVCLHLFDLWMWMMICYKKTQLSQNHAVNWPFLG